MNSLKIAKNIFFTPERMEQSWYDALWALNYLREGFISDAAAMMKIETTVQNRDMIYSYHGETNQLWWDDMNQLLKDLEEAGE